MQYVIKNGHGKSIQSRARFPDYARVAQELLSADAVPPFTVWRHDTIHGGDSYDAMRTRRLCEGVRLALARRSELRGPHS